MLVTCARPHPQRGHVKVKGKVQYRDLEMGVWVIEADDGSTFELAGGDKGLMRKGAVVEVDGDVDANSSGISMVGPRLVVKRYSFPGK